MIRGDLVFSVFFVDRRTAVSMANQLGNLRNRLSASCRRRWLLRVADGGAALGLTLLAALAVDFLCDWTFRFSYLQRQVVLAMFVLLTLAALRRFVWPELAPGETVIDLALAVERRQGIDSDLVAALQFESAGARGWGSPQLQAAVVDSVAGFGDRLSLEGLSDQRHGRKAIPLAIAAGIVVSAAAIFPDHLAAFLDRFLLGSAHYPTRTTITRIAINDTEAFPKGSPAGVTNIPFGGGKGGGCGGKGCWPCHRSGWAKGWCS